ncbi:MAG: tyrosine-protein phosphatase [Erysipelotrichaceae bacterium]|nr:tyrosine-protein phosphatase [Erysipelotrichaceae bacterium]
MHSKKLEFEKLYNVRDLCAIRNKDGFAIKPNCLIRGSRLYEASKNDIKDLYEKYHVRTIFDFRTETEQYEKPDQIYLDTRYIYNGVQQSQTIGVTQDEKSVEEMKKFFAELDKKMKNLDFKITHMCEFYRTLVSDYTCGKYAYFLKEVLQSEEATYWHCSLGRDRCGIGTALVLECLDVDRKDIIEDYLYTNECANMIPNYDGTYVEYINAYYDEVEKKYKSVDKMLEHMGITKKEKQMFKDKFLEK